MDFPYNNVIFQRQTRICNEMYEKSKKKARIEPTSVACRIRSPIPLF